MENILLAYGNRAINGLTSGGSWLSTLPLTNIKDPRLAKAARTTNAKPSSTRFRIDLTARYPLRAMNLHRHNLSAAAKVRFRCGSSPFDIDFRGEGLDERLTYAGGTNGMRLNKDGKLEFATVTNLFLHSNDLTQAAWTKGAVTTLADQSAFFDGSVTMDKMSATASAGVHYVLQENTVSGAPLSPFVFSFFARAAEIRYLQIQLDDGGASGLYSYVDLVEGKAIFGGPTIFGAGAGATMEVEAVPNQPGLWRISLSGTPYAAATTIVRGLVYLIGGPNLSTNFTGDGVMGCHLGGFQLQRGNVATEYVPTTSATVTSVRHRSQYKQGKNLVKHSDDLSKTVWLLGSNMLANGREGYLYGPCVNPKDGGEDIVRAIPAWAFTCREVGNAYLSQTLNLTPLATYTVSYLCDKNLTGSSFVRTQPNNISTNFTFTDIGNGTFMAKATFTMPSNAAYNNPVYAEIFVGGVDPVAGTRFRVTGVQVELGAVATARLRTDTSTAVRAGLLGEPSRTNLCPYSQTITAAAGWSFGSNTIQYGIVGDLLGIPAYCFASNSNAGNVFIQRGITVTGSTTYTVSYLTDVEDTFGGVKYLLSSPSNTTHPGTVTPVAPGVFLVTHTLTTPPGDTALFVTPGRTDCLLGKVFRITAVQVEAGGYATSYIPTRSAAVTRTSETLNSNNFSWFNATVGGSIFMRKAPILGGPDVSFSLWQLDDGTANNAVFTVIESSGRSNYAQANAGGPGAATTNAGFAENGVLQNEVLTFNSTGFSLCKDGGSIVSAALGMPLTSFTRLALLDTGANPHSCVLERFTYVPEVWDQGRMRQFAINGIDSGGFFYNSGWQDALQVAFMGAAPSNWGDQYDVQSNFSEVESRYATVEVEDPFNSIGAVQLGYLFAADGFQPKINAAYGLQDAREDLSTATTTPSGTRYATERRRPKSVKFALPWSTQSEADQIHEMQAEIGTVGEVLYMPEPDNPERNQRYGFLGHLSELSPIEYPYPLTRAIPVQIKQRV